MSYRSLLSDGSMQLSLFTFELVYRVVVEALIY